ncbi:hypothetical protein, partial [Brachyspira catarrhinii]|uniref:hypothetical protein n=1 Tax=Brachyspira catarrhinii TaxID=2528966 RepID=UPI001F2A8239
VDKFAKFVILGVESERKDIIRFCVPLGTRAKKGCHYEDLKKSEVIQIWIDAFLNNKAVSQRDAYGEPLVCN